jgi:serine protease Do
VVARDHARRLLLLKVAVDERWQPVVAAPANSWRVGHTALALGMAATGKVHVAKGIVSALDRDYGRAFQCDTRVQVKHYGGPLVDWQGRVLGIVVPLAPDHPDEVAGAAWYDSGIAFGVPLAPWLEHLDSLRAGKDRWPGLLGISLRPGDPYVLPADVLHCQANAPAFRGGIRSGDRIVAIDSQPITRQMELKHALGPRDAGETVSVRVERNKKQLEFPVTLAEQIKPYAYPQLGVLPVRDDKAPGVAVRGVLVDSPAAAWGLRAGDRLRSVGDVPVTSAAELRAMLATMDPDVSQAWTFERDGQTMNVSGKLATLATIVVPPELPPLPSANVPQQPGAIAAGIAKLNLPEEKNECHALVPPSVLPGQQPGLLVWLAPPTELPPGLLEERFKTLANRYGWVVLVPRPAEAGKWQPDEAGVVRKLIDLAIREYSVDRARVAIMGEGASGALAWRVTLTNRELIRGVATLNAPCPARVPLVNDPVNRLFVFSARSKQSSQRAAIAESEKRLRAGSVPLLTHEVDSDTLGPTDLDLLFRWCDTLDRI